MGILLERFPWLVDLLYIVLWPIEPSGACDNTNIPFNGKVILMFACGFWNFPIIQMPGRRDRQILIYVQHNNGIYEDSFLLSVTPSSKRPPFRTKLIHRNLFLIVLKTGRAFYAVNYVLIYSVKELHGC